MKARLTLQGFDEAKKAFRQLVPTLVKEARPILMGKARKLRDEIRAAYPKGPTGNLRKGVKVVQGRRSRVRVAVHVNSTAPHAWWFEYGTKERKAGPGWNRGRIKPLNVFVPRVVRTRIELEAHELRELLARQGLNVDLATSLSESL